MERIERISREVLDFNGYEAQSLIAIEEIADVHNMLVQLEMYFDIEKINKVRIEKIERIKGRIEKKKAEMTGGVQE